MSRISLLCSLAAALEEEKLTRILTAYNEQLKDLVTKGDTKGKINYPKLARHIHYVALAVAEDRHKKRVSATPHSDTSNAGIGSNDSTSSKGPAWKYIADKVEHVCGSHSEDFKGLLPKKVTNDRISSFATFGSMANGVSTPCFYVALVLFIIYSSETGETDRDFFKRAIPKRERDLSRLLFDDMSSALRSEVRTDTDDEEHEITVNFNIKRSKTDEFIKYFDQYAFSDDGRAHLVLYRPTRSDPAILIKTFLSIGPHSEDKDGYAYAHYYKPVDGTPRTRFSGGKVLPMDNGLFMAGGQKPHALNERTDKPFISLKTMAFRWTDIDNNAPVLPGLVMSTNFEGEQLVSRIVARITPIPHSDELELRSVRNDDLVENLKADIEKEKAVIEEITKNKSLYYENASNFVIYDSEIDIRKLADRILSLTNNRPNPKTGVAAPSGYSRRAQRKIEKLTSPRLSTVIDDAFEHDDSAYQDKDGNYYNFWEHTRFGPLTIS